MNGTMSDTYYNDLARCAPMSHAEERVKAAAMAALREEREELVEKLPNANAKLRRHFAEVERAYESARNAFVCANLRLVVKIAAQYGDGKLPLSDLIQEGNIGLMTAVERFDHTRGVRFCTYAAWWIRHRVSRAITNHNRAVRVPNHVAQTSSKLLKAARKFEAAEGRAPTLEELAEITDISPTKARISLRATSHVMSFDATLKSDDRPLSETLAHDAASSLDEVVTERQMQDVAEALGTLTEIEADILRKRFGFDVDEPMTLRELGALHSLSRERIRQIQNGALSKIKRRLVEHATN